MDSNEKFQYSSDIMDKTQQNQLELTGGDDTNGYDSLRMSPTSEYQLTNNIRPSQQEERAAKVTNDSSTFVIDYNVPVFGVALESNNTPKSAQLPFSFKTFLNDESISLKVQTHRQQQHEQNINEMISSETHANNIERINSAGTSSSSTSSNNNSTHFDNLDERQEDNGAKAAELKSQDCDKNNSNNIEFQQEQHISGQVNEEETEKRDDVNVNSMVEDTNLSESCQLMLEV